MKKILNKCLLLVFSLFAIAVANTTMAFAKEGDKWKIDVPVDENTYHYVKSTISITNPRQQTFPKTYKLNLYEKDVDNNYTLLYSLQGNQLSYDQTAKEEMEFNYRFKADCQYYMSFSADDVDLWPYTIESEIVGEESRVTVKLLSPKIPTTYKLAYKNWASANMAEEIATITKDAYIGDVLSDDELKEIAQAEDLGFKFEVQNVETKCITNQDGKTGQLICANTSYNVITVNIVKLVSLNVNYFYDGTLYKTVKYEDGVYYSGTSVLATFSDKFNLNDAYDPELYGYLRDPEISAMGVDYGELGSMNTHDNIAKMQRNVSEYSIDVKYKSNFEIWYNKSYYDKNEGWLKDFSGTVSVPALYPTRYEEIDQDMIINILKEKLGDEYTEKIGDSDVENFEKDGSFGTSVIIQFESDKIPDNPVVPDPDPDPTPDPEPDQPEHGTYIKISMRYNVPVPDYHLNSKYYQEGGASDYYKIKNWRILVTKNGEVIDSQDIEIIGWKINEYITNNDLYFSIPDDEWDDYKIFAMPLDAGDNNATYKVTKTNDGFHVDFNCKIDLKVKTYIVVNGKQVAIEINDAKVGDTDARIEYLIQNKVKEILDSIDSFGLNEWRVGMYVIDENTGDNVFCHGFVLTLDDGDEVETYKYIEYTKLVTVIVDGKYAYEFEISEDDLTKELFDEGMKDYEGPIDFSKVEYVDTVYEDGGLITVYFKTVEDVVPDPDPIPTPDPTPEEPKDPEVPDEPKEPEQPKDEPKHEEPKVDDTKVVEVAVEPIKTTAPQTGDENKNIPYYILSGIAMLGLVFGLAYVKSYKD